MKLLTIDQSMASCAYVVLEDAKTPIFKEVLHTTGSSDPKPWQVGFSTPVEQMDYISEKILSTAKSFNVDHIVMESLSFGSAGNATRDLAGLFFCIQLTLFRNGYTSEQLHTIAPMSAKSWAWNFLPDELQGVPNDKGTKINKRKMGKDEMVIVAKTLYPGFLDGYNKTGKNGGLTDLADAILIGRTWRTKQRMD